MNEYVYLLILIPIFILAFLVGCSPVIPEPPVEPELPIGDIFKIEIEPKEVIIGIGESYEFTVHAYTILCEEVYIDGSQLAGLKAVE